VRHHCNCACFMQMAARETGFGAVEQYMHAGKLLALELTVRVLENPHHHWSALRPEVCGLSLFCDVVIRLQRWAFFANVGVLCPAKLGTSSCLASGRMTLVRLYPSGLIAVPERQHQVGIVWGHANLMLSHCHQRCIYSRCHLLEGSHGADVILQVICFYLCSFVSS